MQDRYEMAPSYSPPPASSPQWRSGFANQHGPAGWDEEEKHIVWQCHLPRRAWYIWKFIRNVSMWILSLNWLLDWPPTPSGHSQSYTLLIPTQPQKERGQPHSQRTDLQDQAHHVHLSHHQHLTWPWSTRRSCSPKSGPVSEIATWKFPLGRTFSLLTATTIREQLKVQRCQDSIGRPPR